MKNSSTISYTLGQLIGLTLLAAFLVAALRSVVPDEKLFPDVICYWAAAKNLAAGQNPYAIELQKQVQQAYGWDIAANGFGIYPFLPYYYPPWFAMLWLPLLPLGLAGAKVAWLFLNVEMALLSGYLLSQVVPQARSWIVQVVVPMFLFSLACMVLGQTSILILFLMVLGWWLLERQADRLAGATLAWLTIKPQLTAVLLLALLFWVLRQRRWRVAQGVCVTLGLLGLVSTVIVPSWLGDMLVAGRETPSPTEYFPWIGNTWLLVLKTLGISAWRLWVLYAAAALPMLLVVVRAALNGVALKDLFALGSLAAFFVSPYARHYDFTILLIPLFVLTGGRLSKLARGTLLLALALLPYIQQSFLVEFKERYDPGSKFLLEVSYFWVPALLLGAWLLSRKTARSRQQDECQRGVLSAEPVVDPRVYRHAPAMGALSGNE
jgi:hypothetical protein